MPWEVSGRRPYAYTPETLYSKLCVILFVLTLVESLKRKLHNWTGSTRVSFANSAIAHLDEEISKNFKKQFLLKIVLRTKLFYDNLPKNAY